MCHKGAGTIMLKCLVGASTISVKIGYFNKGVFTYKQEEYTFIFIILFDQI